MMRKVIDFDVYKNLSENIVYHLENNISLFENVFRVGSVEYFNLLREARILYENDFLFEDREIVDIFKTTDIGLFEEFEGEMVPLDFPILEADYEGREVELNSPMRSSGPKKFKVYVKNPKTEKIKVIHFGDAKGGLTAKIDNDAARKSFVARHKCELKDDKMTPGYWSCRLPKFKNLYSGTYNGFW